ncbi:MAG TPA: hypothetical protein VK203_25480 [Nostocaceae cyanobacterium]|nr:hypothetical protein [Nostocaceae cyanobacterium]
MYTTQNKKYPTSINSSHTAEPNRFAQPKFVVQPQSEPAQPSVETENNQQTNSPFPPLSLFTNRPAPAPPPRVQMKLNLNRLAKQQEGNSTPQISTASHQIIQRDPEKPKAPNKKKKEAEPTPEEELQLAQKIVADIKNGGLTVAVYAASNVGSVAEFQRQANQFAADHLALGVNGGRVRQGEKAAMQMEDDIPSRLSALSVSVGQLLDKFPELTGGKCLVVPIKTLAIFTHGEPYTLQASGKGGWISSLEKWVSGITPYLAPSPQILMYACSTAGTPDEKHSKRTNGLPFADAVRLEMQKQLKVRYGENANVDPEVWGHTNAGHTTANNRLKGFGGAAGGGTGLLDTVTAKITELALTNVGGDPLNENQLKKLQEAAKKSTARILQAETGTKDPTNAYIREVPLIGISRVWEQISTKDEPNFADLGLSTDTNERLGLALAQFRKRFDVELPKLENEIKILQKPPAPKKPATSKK